MTVDKMERSDTARRIKRNVGCVGLYYKIKIPVKCKHLFSAFAPVRAFCNIVSAINGPRPVSHAKSQIMHFEYMRIFFIITGAKCHIGRYFLIVSVA
jgi:hypothetical protein